MNLRPSVRHVHRQGVHIIAQRRLVRTLPAFHNKDQSSSRDGLPSWSPSVASPRQLVEYLNDYIVGQERAKKILAVAVYNHYNRVRANLGHHNEGHTDEFVSGSNEIPLTPHPFRRRAFPAAAAPQPIPLFEKSNVLVIGPSGTGKTLLARTLARILDVPFSVSDATAFTQAGYVGDDVEMCVQRLLQAANWDPHRAATGIIYIDESDKLARRTTGGDNMQRDIGGEGVQQALLRMMEGSVVTVTASKGSDGFSEGRRRDMGAPTPESYQIDTSNVLFILSGAFVGLDTIVKRRIAKGSIGFGANLGDASASNDKFVPFFTKNGQAADPWSLVEPKDLVSYGYIPEFVSRLPVISSLNPLAVEDLYRILTDVKGSLVSQYTALFNYSGVDIRFTDSALKEIAQLAVERGGGARGLRGICENLLLDAMYEVPGSGVRYVLITDKVVRRESPAMYWSRGDAAAFWAEVAREEAKST
ncbi:related to MCX1-Mitochondrial ATP-binding protein [Serendipita indica DSM 11827]|uniref:Related to MCX1-Mitochondrial ATP-binding protein n=1 Tax=Serendipita indica (strain DSM 11827) TaxID=1109443 RepID=G4TR21_SERID|nr:related to MCX1-Mitochondrial ATP-binding protein [Serendipita indica DSM 11827]